ncbi:MAG TPA: FAD binding domain-containing protein [Candidatus Dormibacteraeota bacterium]|nr:FAD binding domain-containing protein [Candidatus Dormibacteraeota bacterium]
MLRLPRLQYLRPRSIAEATELAAQNPGAMFIAGGTDLVPNLKRRQFDVTTLISLNALPDGRLIEGDVKNGVTIGAGATLDEVAHRDLLAGAFRALAQACGSVSTPQVRYMGTLGGNLLVDPRCNYYNQTHSWRKAVGFCMKKDGDICLVARSSPRCWAVSSSDSAPAALALNAEVTLQGVQGTHRMAAAALYKDDGMEYTTKRPDEVITAVHLPAVRGRMTSAYWKLRRRPAFDFPILGVAVAIGWDDGVVREARGALGAVGSHPVDITAFLGPLRGERPADDLIAEVAEAADKPSRPLDNTDLSHYWRKRMSKVYIERALRDACGLDPLAGRLTAQVASR